MRQMFPLVAASASKVLPAKTLRRISFGHVEADECVYLRTVHGSTPKLAATSVGRRPACQFCVISTTSITSNALLAIEPRSTRRRARRLPGRGTQGVDLTPPPQTDNSVDPTNNYVNETPPEPANP
jgi:hypothetical protein